MLIKNCLPCSNIDCRGEIVKVYAEFMLIDMKNELYRKKGGGYFGSMRVGAWLEKIAINLIKNDTCNSVVTSPSLREYGPRVSYEEMVNILDDSFWCDAVRFDLAYNAGDSTWTIKNFIVPVSLYKAMEKVTEEKDTNACKKEKRILCIPIDDIFNGLFYGTGNANSKPIAQWILESAEGQIKTLLCMSSDDYAGSKVTMEKFLNLIGCGKNYRWADIKRILKLSNPEDKIEFTLRIKGTDIRIRNMELPTSMKNAIKKMHEEIEEDKKQHREFSFDEMLNGLMLAKCNELIGRNTEATSEYKSWLACAIHMLLNKNKNDLYSYTIKSHEPEITWSEAIVEFAKRNKYGDTFIVTYSFEEVEKCIDQHGQIHRDPILNICDIKKVEE